MNLRPSGYEPDELPDCSTPQSRLAIILGARGGCKTGNFAVETGANLYPAIVTKGVEESLSAEKNPFLGQNPHAEVEQAAGEKSECKKSQHVQTEHRPNIGFRYERFDALFRLIKVH